MQSNLDSSFSESGAINSGASSHLARSNEPTRTADNVVEIAPDNSSLEMLASMATSLERVARDSASRPIETCARIQTDTSFAFLQLSQPTRAHSTGTPNHKCRKCHVKCQQTYKPRLFHMCGLTMVGS